MHEEPVITRNSLIAWTLWVGVALSMVTMFALFRNPLIGLYFGTLGCALSAGAATVSIRGFIIRLAKREHDAFVMGREVGHAEGGGGSVRQLR